MNYGFQNSDQGYSVSNYGGGFQTSPGMDTSPNQKNQNQRRSGAYQSLMPVTIKQLFAASSAVPEDSFKIDNHELHQITIVGCILQVTPSTTNTSLQIDDGTGKIEARIWTNETDSDLAVQKRNAWREGVYVRVVGNLKSFQNKRNIAAFKIIPITDPNEITYHFLEVIYVHMSNTGSITLQGTATTNNYPVTSNAPSFGNQISANQKTYNVHSNSLSDLNSAILDFVKHNQGSKGVEIKVISASLNKPIAVISQAIDFLSSEGHVYNAVDPDHFMTTS